MKKRVWSSALLVMLLALSLTFGLSGCGKRTESPPETAETPDAYTRSLNVAEDTSPPDEEETFTRSLNVAEDSSTPDEDEAEEPPGEESEPAIDRDGSYTSRDDVALYLHTYGELPQNFITKKQAKKLGWSGGSLENYAPGMCIGGDYFGNYEGLLPKDKEYHECDIDTLGKKSRGAKRIIYSDDGYIYYTDDHYESFELLYSP